jgi:hypothetical protein
VTNRSGKFLIILGRNGVRKFENHCLTKLLQINIIRNSFTISRHRILEYLHAPKRLLQVSILGQMNLVNTYNMLKDVLFFNLCFSFNVSLLSLLWQNKRTLMKSPCQKRWPLLGNSKHVLMATNISATTEMWDAAFCFLWSHDIFNIQYVVKQK